MSDPIQTAVVTGASRGFGRAIAAALVATSTSVVGIARDEPDLRAVRDELGEGFTPVAADATDEVLAQDVWIRTALREPLAPGSVVFAMSSGAAVAGSLLSGGYAGAKAAIRHLGGYAAEESKRAGLGIRFVTLLPQLTPVTGLGAAAVAARAARQGVDRDTFVEGLRPILTSEQVAKAVVELAGDPGSAPEYLVGGAGLRPIG